jgi:hypothetical protein
MCLTPITLSLFIPESEPAALNTPLEQYLEELISTGLPEDNDWVIMTEGTHTMTWDYMEESISVYKLNVQRDPDINFELPPLKSL